MAETWRNSVFPAATFVAKFCGEIFVLVLRTFEPPPKVATDPPPQISPRLWQKLIIFWSATAQFVRGWGKAESRKFTARHRHREVWETGLWKSQDPSGLGNVAQERNCMRLGSVSVLSERSWVVWSAPDGHHRQVPIMCRRRAPKCQVPLMNLCTRFKKSGQTEEQAKKTKKKIIAKFRTHPASKKFADIEGLARGLWGGYGGFAEETRNCTYDGP